MQPNPPSQPVRIAIVGAAGYSGEELIRVLARHRCVEIRAVTSRSLAGQAVHDVLPKLAGGVDPELCFTASEPDALAGRDDIDLVFLALPHGVASEYAVPLVESGKRVIDLSADFRLGCPVRYEEYYGKPHPAPLLLEKAAYVIPEIHTSGWQNAPLIASPGCYPTSAIVPLYPLLRDGLLAPKGIVINSMSGVSGAGKKLSEDYLYCTRDSSAKAYGIPRHRHLSEIEEQLSHAAGRTIIVNFTPHLVPMQRGIATTTLAIANTREVGEIYASWNAFFSKRPFIRLLPAQTTPDTAHVVHTNRIDFSAALDPRTGAAIVTSAEDNLLKGAGGQAVQIMNLWFGFPETEGLC